MAPPLHPTDPRLDALFGPEGQLSEAIDGFEERPGQETMLRQVARAIEERQVLLVEAGTGTGKSLAYLIAAALSGERVIVATGTRNLQDQLFHKDIPLVARVLGRPIRAALLKGRTNYLCLSALDDALHDGALFSTHGSALQRLSGWSRTTATGDRAELAEVAGTGPLWSAVSTGADGCTGQRCEHYERCFVMQARARAAEAEVVVVNHHLFFADLALRDRAGIALLPPADVVVFDEAHNLEDVAATFFGLHVSDWRFRDLLGDVRRAFAGAHLGIPPIIASVGEKARAFFACYEPLLPRRRLSPEEVPPEVDSRYYALDTSLAGLELALLEQTETAEVFGRLTMRASLLRAELEPLAMPVVGGPMVTWVEQGARAIFLRAAPVDIGTVLQGPLFDQHEALIFTSATLTTGGDFTHYRARIGVDFECLEEAVASPFDYEQQTILYTPRDLPDPRRDDFLERACQRIAELIALTDGRAFVLFTSYANMNGAHAILEPVVDNPLLLQSGGSRELLLEEFRRTPRAVLFGTGAFWEGVDVVGDQLSQVIIDKLPFAHPGDPLVGARMDRLRASGGNPFMDYQVPTAIIQLKQGFGRLIRSRRDRGIVTVLDPRLSKARYGRRFIESLPPARRVFDMPALRAAWDEISPAGGSGPTR